MMSIERAVGGWVEGWQDEEEVEEEEEGDGDSGWGEGGGPCFRSYRGGEVAGDGVAEVVVVGSVCVADQVVARSMSVETRRKMKNSDGVGYRFDDESLALGVCIDAYADRGSAEIGVWGRENSTLHQTACAMTEVCTGWWDWNLG